MAAILAAIFEQDILGSRYGDRPKVGAGDAVDRFTVTLQIGVSSRRGG